MVLKGACIGLGFAATNARSAADGRAITGRQASATGTQCEI